MKFARPRQSPVVRWRPQADMVHILVLIAFKSSWYTLAPEFDFQERYSTSNSMARGNSPCCISVWLECSRYLVPRYTPIHLKIRWLQVKGGNITIYRSQPTKKDSEQWPPRFMKVNSYFPSNFPIIIPWCSHSLCYTWKMTIPMTSPNWLSRTHVVSGASDFAHLHWRNHPFLNLDLTPSCVCQPLTNSSPLYWRGQTRSNPSCSISRLVQVSGIGLPVNIPEQVA
jgi:hypothetical protein